MRRKYQGVPAKWVDLLEQHRIWLLISGVGFLLLALICTGLIAWTSLRYPHTNPQEAPPVAELRMEFAENPSPKLAEQIRELEYLQRQQFFTQQTDLDGLAWVLLFSTLFGLVQLKVWNDVRPAPGDAAEKNARETGGDEALEGAAPKTAEAAPAEDDAEEISTVHVDELLEHFGKEQSALIPILNAIQAKYRYLPEKLLAYLQEELGLTRSHIDGVISFYHQYRLKPCGKNLVRVCIGTACHVAGAPRIIDTLKRHYDMGKDEDTSGDQLVTIEEVACMGCCMLAPAATVEDKMLAHTGAAQIVTEVARPKEKAKTKEKEAQKAEPVAPEKTFALCHCSSCEASGSHDVEAALRREIQRRGLPAIVEDTTCAGESSLSPVVHVRKDGEEIARYTNVLPGQIGELGREAFGPRNAWEKLLFWFDDATGQMAHEGGSSKPTRAVIADDEAENAQKRIAAADATRVSPLSLDNYKSTGGFQALNKAVTDMTPEAVIDEILQSGLRGRGGAGFPTGIKWQTVREVGNDPLIVCNGDEGDPGAFMDRMLMENFPYRVLEGMALAAYATGASEGVLYIRAEYPLAIRRIETAIAACEKAGLLGEKLCGTDQPFHVRVVSGAGAFVCGEETALLASLEGRRGEPRQRPPFPAQSGAWERSTLINNVESFCNVPWILRNGAGLFKAASAGEDRSAGTKTFALAGKVRRPGLIEVPVGTTLREIVEDIGGGVPDGKKIKAIQIGGPSGGCVPADMLDTPIDYDTLQASGSIMGSGGMVVLDEDDCIVDVARYFMEFAMRESCGKCAPCRLGTARMHELLTKLCEGRGGKKDLAELESLAGTTKSMSLCGLGKTAPNPLLSTLQHFREEYEAHLKGECPAGVCPDLIKYTITDDCVGCTLCARDCPVDAIVGPAYEKHVIDVDLCIRCNACREVCPEDAVLVVPIKDGQEDDKKKAKPAAGDKDKDKPATAKPTAKAAEKEPEPAGAK